MLLVTGGRLGDIFGRRRMFLFGVVIFAISSAAIGLAPTDALLVAGRAVQGIGAAFMMPATLSIITNAFPPHERGKAIGTWAGVSALALAIGPVVGGFLTEYVSWRAIFFLNLPVAAGAVAVTLFAAHESRDETVERSVDIPGIAALTVGPHRPRPRPGRGQPVGLGLGRHPRPARPPAVVGLVALRARSRRHSRVPMVDFTVLPLDARSWARTWSRFVVSFAMLAMFFFIALYMQNILGYSPLQAGVRFLPSTVILIIRRPGRRPPVGPHRPADPDDRRAAARRHLAAPGSRRSASARRYGFLLPGFVLMGFGMALAMSPMSTAAMNAVHQTKAGVASGILSMSRMVGGTFGVAVTGRAGRRPGPQQARRAAARRARRTAAIRWRRSGRRRAGANDGARVIDAMNQAYVHALSNGLKVGAGGGLLGAVVAMVPPWPTGRRGRGARDRRFEPEADAGRARRRGLRALSAPSPTPPSSRTRPGPLPRGPGRRVLGRS